jgi:hypothetical protein
LTADETFDAAIAKNQRLIAGLSRRGALCKHYAGVHERNTTRT